MDKTDKTPPISAPLLALATGLALGGLGWLAKGIVGHEAMDYCVYSLAGLYMVYHLISVFDGRAKRRRERGADHD